MGSSLSSHFQDMKTNFFLYSLSKIPLRIVCLRDSNLKIVKEYDFMEHVSFSPDGLMFVGTRNRNLFITTTETGETSEPIFIGGFLQRCLFKMRQFL